MDEYASWDNPLLTDANRVKDLLGEHSLVVPVVCADIFMVHPLRATSGDLWDLGARILERSAELGVSYLAIPCVDSASLRVPENLENIRRTVPELVKVASSHGVTISLETDLGPKELNSLVGDYFDHRVKVTYDIGNSASLGYDWREELSVLAPLFSGVHIKDRILGGGSVPLGTGDADVVGVLTALLATGFNGPVTMQAFRDREGLNVFDSQLAWLRARLSLERSEF